MFHGISPKKMKKFALFSYMKTSHEQHQKIVYTSQDSILTNICRYLQGLSQTFHLQLNQNGTEQLCNEVLFNCKKTDRGTHEYTPKHIYCFQQLSKSLDNLLSMLGILDHCNAWRKRPATRSVYSDIYDSSVSQKIVTNCFPREQTSLALLLNLDSFKPGRSPRTRGPGEGVGEVGERVMGTHSS